MSLFAMSSNKHGNARDALVDFLEMFLYLVTCFFYRHQFKQRIDLVIVRLASVLIRESDHLALRFFFIRFRAIAPCIRGATQLNRSRNSIT